VTKRVLVPQEGAFREDPELKRLEQAVRNNPRSAAAWTELGNWHFDHDLPEEAVRAYESSLVIKPGDPDVMTDLGVMHRRLHNHDKALELFAKASELAPDHLQSRFNRGVVLFYDLQREEEGMRVWSELTRRAPDYRTPDGRRLAEQVKEFYKNRNP
jgi:tetratricopeptide (TPR) repeat protein